MTVNTQMIEDAKKIEELAASLEQEANDLQQILVDVKDKVEQETADDRQILNDSLNELDALEKEADQEENQGQVGAVQDKINYM